MGQERIIHAALLGAGTVGSGVYKLVKDLEEEIISKTGARLVVDKILVRDTTKAREGIPSELLIDRWDEILNDPQIEIVIEVMGGIRPALTWLEEASCPPRATLEGHCRALIENYRDIVEFSPEKIRLSSPQGEIVLDGSEMCLAQVRPECLMVVGRIDSVSMPEGGAVHG